MFKKNNIIIDMTLVEWLENYVPLTVGILTLITLASSIAYQVHKKFTVYIRDEITSVAKELRPNGGSSIKDQVSRMEKDHEDLRKDIKKINQEVTDLKKDSSRLEEKIDKLFEALLNHFDKK